MAEGLLPPPSTSVSDVIEAAKRIFLLTLAKGLPLALVAIFLSQLATLYWTATGKPMALSEPRDATFWSLMVVGSVAYALLSGLLMLRQRAMVEGRMPALRAELQVLMPRWGDLFLVSLLGTILVMLGTIALVLPGVYLLVGFLVAQPALVFERLSPLKALARSVALLKPIWWRACATGLIALLVVVVCWLAAAAMLGLLDAALGAIGVSHAATAAVDAAVQLGAQAVAVVYFSAVWISLHAAAAAHSAASSSA